MEFDGGEAHDSGPLERGFGSASEAFRDVGMPRHGVAEEDEVIDIMNISHPNDVATEPNTRRDDDSPFSIGPEEAHFPSQPEAPASASMHSLSHFDSHRSSHVDLHEGLELRDSLAEPDEAFGDHDDFGAHPGGPDDSFSVNHHADELHPSFDPMDTEPGSMQNAAAGLGAVDDAALFATMMPQYEPAIDEHNVEWTGDCIKEIGTRRFYDGCRVDGQEFHAYDHAEIRSRDLDDTRPAVARIIAMYEQNGQKKVALEWFLRFSDVQKHIEYMRSIEVHAPTPPPGTAGPGLSSSSSSIMHISGSSSPLSSSGNFGDRQSSMGLDDAAMMKRKRGRPPKKRHQNMEDTVEYMHRRGMSELYTTSHPTVSESSAAVLYRKCEVVFANSTVDPEVPAKYRDGSVGYYWYRKALDLKTCALTSCKPRGIKPKNYTDALEKRYRNSDKRNAPPSTSALLAQAGPSGAPPSSAAPAPGAPVPNATGIQPNSDLMQVDSIGSAPSSVVGTPAPMTPAEKGAPRSSGPKKRSRPQIQQTAQQSTQPPITTNTLDYDAQDDLHKAPKPKPDPAGYGAEDDVSIDDSVSGGGAELPQLQQTLPPTRPGFVPIRPGSTILTFGRPRDQFPGPRSDHVYPALMQKMNQMESLVQKSIATIQAYLEETRSELRRGVRDVKKMTHQSNKDLFDSLRPHFPELPPIEPYVASPETTPPGSPLRFPPISLPTTSTPSSVPPTLIIATNNHRSASLPSTPAHGITPAPAPASSTKKRKSSGSASKPKQQKDGIQSVPVGWQPSLSGTGTPTSTTTTTKTKKKKAPSTGNSDEHGTPLKKQKISATSSVATVTAPAPVPVPAQVVESTMAIEPLVVATSLTPVDTMSTAPITSIPTTFKPDPSEMTPSLEGAVGETMAVDPLEQPIKIEQQQQHHHSSDHISPTSSVAVMPGQSEPSSLSAEVPTRTSEFVPQMAPSYEEMQPLQTQPHLSLTFAAPPPAPAPAPAPAPIPSPVQLAMTLSMTVPTHMHVQLPMPAPAAPSAPPKPKKKRTPAPPPPNAVKSDYGTRSKRSKFV